MKIFDIVFTYPDGSAFGEYVEAASAADAQRVLRAAVAPRMIAISSLIEVPQAIGDEGIRNIPGDDSDKD